MTDYFDNNKDNDIIEKLKPEVNNEEIINNDFTDSNMDEENVNYENDHTVESSFEAQNLNIQNEQEVSATANETFNGNENMIADENYNQSYQSYMSFQDSELKKKLDKEKAKFEKKQNKKAKKLQKKNAKKEKGTGVVGRIVGFVVCSMAFGIIALGTMYFAGDMLGIINFDKDKDSKYDKISYTSVSNKVEKETVVSDDNNETDKIVAQVMDVSDVVDNVMPSVVSITSTQKVQSGMNFWYDYYFNNGDEYEEQTGAGSGIIIGQNDSELLIVTNNHVVEGADSLQVQFIDDETVNAYIKGTDSEKDLAIVIVKLEDIKDKTMGNIKIATMGNSDELEVGEGTIAIGNALGYGQSVTVGVVSALNKEVVIDNKTMELIQTDAAINPGNSGGALLNTEGELIGINVAKYSSSSVEGMGFAIPVTSVSEVIDGLMNMETREKVDPEDQGYLNIYGRDVTEELSEIYNAPSGVLVVDVVEEGAADKAGIQKGDIITKIDGVKVASMEELSTRLQYYKKGEEVVFTIEYLKDREYVEKEVTVVLSENKE